MIIKSSQNITKYNVIVISKHKGRLKKKHDKLGFWAETRLSCFKAIPRHFRAHLDKDH